MTNQTENCPGNLKAIRDSPTDQLLDRSLSYFADFHHFARPWVTRARRAAERDRWFEGLIYLWVTFNAWESLVVSNRHHSGRDSYLWQAAGLDRQLKEAFDQLLTTDHKFQERASSFQGLWPVFSARALADQRVEPWAARDLLETRAAFRVRCFSAELTKGDYEPRCYLDHQPEDGLPSGGSPSNVPLDWAHVLGAIYKVRCNLFHGGKSFRSSKDIEFVRYAYLILDQVLSVAEPWAARRTPYARSRAPAKRPKSSELE